MAGPGSQSDAEGEVLSALLDQHCSASELAPLAAKHFFADINRAVWEAVDACAPGDLVGISAFLKARGYRGDVDREVANLVLGQPWISVPRLKAHARHLVELWARREIVSLLRSLEADLCHGHATVDEARKRFDTRAFARCSDDTTPRPGGPTRCRKAAPRSDR